MPSVQADELIALETAMRDLARLYESALIFAPLRPRAEAELLPHMSELGARLRQHLRSGTLDAPAQQAAADALHHLTDEWRRVLAAMQADPAVATAAAALDRDDQDTLRALLPRVFAQISAAGPPLSQLFYAVPLAAPRRRPGSRPFLSAEDAAERIVACRTGIAPVGDGEWWDTAFPWIALVETRELLDTPVALALDLSSTSYSLFTAVGDPTLRIYTRRLQTPFSVVLSSDPHDDWWEAAVEPYSVFRDRLASILGEHNLTVTIFP